MSIVKIPKSVCTHLKTISKYNHNYYMIPVEVDGCNVVYEICDENHDGCEYVLGTLQENDFKDDGDHIFYGCDSSFEEYYSYIILDDKYKNIKIS